MSDIGDSEDRIREELGLDDEATRDDDPNPEDPLGQRNALAPPD